MPKRAWLRLSALLAGVLSLPAEQYNFLLGALLWLYAAAADVLDLLLDRKRAQIVLPAPAPSMPVVHRLVTSQMPPPDFASLSKFAQFAAVAEARRREEAFATPGRPGGPLRDCCVRAWRHAGAAPGSATVRLAA